MEVLGRCFGLYSVALTGFGPSLTWEHFSLRCHQRDADTVAFTVQRNGFLCFFIGMGRRWHSVASYIQHPGISANVERLDSGGGALVRCS
ncbi:hypothetical protein IWZ03DRAFT_388352 [Phyllosticta citriasiana]|uniref:Uncharacterized protein n=1 Tax=Phyllosticta citriasiana TaxID=595635 RepID=A0ABR1KC05_9PEZI